MSEQLELPQAEALLRKHYARLDPGTLRSDATARIRAQLEAEAGLPSGVRRPGLQPIRPTAPRTRFGLGWSMAATAVVAVLVVTWLAIGRPATPSVAASPSAILSPSESTLPSASGGIVAPSPSGAASHQNAIAFVDRLHGIVVGDYQGQGAIWTTADEGQTWASQLVSTPPLDSVAVLGSRAWASATCSGAQGCTPAVLASSDSGTTWAVVGSSAVTSLTFVSATHGFGIDASSPGGGGLVETNDGGASWTAAKVATPCEAGFFPVGVSFADARDGWAACASDKAALGSAPKEIVATMDGGASWTMRSRADGGVAPADSLPFAGAFRGLQMLSSGTGIAWLWNVGLIRTTDGAKTWARLPLGQETGNLQWPGAAISPDGNLFALTVDLTAADGSATLNLGFSDGRDWKPYVEFGGLPTPGTTPTPEPTSPPQPAFAGSGVAFFDASNGIAIGNDASHSYLWRTADGGKTWTTKPLGKPIAILQAAHGDRVWISVSTCPDGAQPGDPGCTSVVERSDDRGATWSVIAHRYLRSISFGDATHGFGIGPGIPSGDTRPGNGGGIDVTADGGSTWTALADPYPCGTYDPMSVSFVSATHGWVGCSGGVGAGQGMKAVMETVDGGRNWVMQARVDVPTGQRIIGSISSSDYLDTIAMDATGAGFMTGLRGSTFRTTDGGRTWTACPPGEFDAFNTSQAAIVAGGPWFIIQSGSNIATDQAISAARLMRSDDQGATWTQVGPLLPNP